MQVKFYAEILITMNSWLMFEKILSCFSILHSLARSVVIITWEHAVHENGTIIFVK